MSKSINFIVRPDLNLEIQVNDSFMQHQTVVAELMHLALASRAISCSLQELSNVMTTDTPVLTSGVLVALNGPVILLVAVIANGRLVNGNIILSNAVVILVVGNLTHVCLL